MSVQIQLDFYVFSREMKCYLSVCLFVKLSDKISLLIWSISMMIIFNSIFFNLIYNLITLLFHNKDKQF